MVKQQYINNIKEQYTKICTHNIPKLKSLLEVTNHTLSSIQREIGGYTYHTIKVTLLRVEDQFKLFTSNDMLKETTADKIYSKEDLYRLSSIIVGVDFVAMQEIAPEDLVDFITNDSGVTKVTEITRG